MKGRRFRKARLSVFLAIIAIILVILGCFLVKNPKKNKNNRVVIQESFLESKGIYYEPEYNTDCITEINEINLSHKGIKNKYQFVYMTDLQASIPDENLEDAKIKNALANRYQHFKIQHPNQMGQEEIFDEIITYTNRMDADALLLGGDVIDSPAESNFNLLNKELNQKLEVRYLYTLGNHDWSFSWNYHSKEMEEIYYPRFEEFMDDIQVSYLEYEDLIVLAINDGKGQFEEEAVQKVKRVLKKKKPTIVMVHVPLSTQEIIEQEKSIRDRISAIGEYGVEPSESSQKIIDMILSEDYDVFYVLAGHLHFRIKNDLNERIIEEVGEPAFKGAISVIKINNQEEEEK